LELFINFLVFLLEILRYIIMEVDILINYI
jgi:hypothetical protein